MANETTSQKSGFHVLDAFIFLLVALCIAAIVMRIVQTSVRKEQFETTSVTFSVIDVAEDTAKALHAGSTVYLASNNDKIGSISTVTYGPATLSAKDENGNLVSVAHPTRKTITGTALLTGIWTDDGFLINGTLLASAGATVLIYTNEVECTLTVEKVERAD